VDVVNKVVAISNLGYGLHGCFSSLVFPLCACGKQRVDVNTVAVNVEARLGFVDAFPADIKFLYI